jgi:hypothetical protein
MGEEQRDREIDSIAEIGKLMRRKRVKSNWWSGTIAATAASRSS